ncbi:MAG: DNA alkylation repair protein [Dysgonamonadaceae bacterium]|nr:DNA alkylation repair protein [Dysgonamonadaceae bacterium]MDD4727850.1 DNA alkylation repair protein [Dysgonamonadaceae bacterium]
MKAKTIKQQIVASSNKDKAQILSSFFQTKEGQYAHGDVFLGVSVPQIREIVALYKKLPLEEVYKLLHSKFHECRFAALIILVNQFEKANIAEREIIFNFYLSNTQKINNWDLVDVSCHKIVGSWLIDKDRTLLYELAKSDWLWDQRIAIVSTIAFIRNNDFEDILTLSEFFLTHPHHLIHKACGWMLREAGKRDKATLINFLNKFAPQMPRVMLRYSIEKLSDEERKSYLRALK